MEPGVEMHKDSILQFEGVPQRFSYNDLSEATGGFSKLSILGYGGFGVVYRGELKSGIQVAVKRMNPAATQSQGMKEFKSEVQIISQVSHRNLIKLRGFCADGDLKEYMLVYDLMPNGSPDDALFNSAKGTTFLSWPQKFKILSGAADGLSYLHQGLDEQVIHRDIKCSNILLDKGWNGKLGDFGIARMVAHQGRAATTDMAGTVGYIAPEVFSENQFSDKADVYAFGVVVLEVACGRRVFPSSSHKMGLVQWISLAHSKGNLLKTVDERHRDDDTEQIQRVLRVGFLCTQLNPQDRPSMRSVVQMLAADGMVPSIPTSNPTSGHPSGTSVPRGEMTFGLFSCVPTQDPVDSSSCASPEAESNAGTVGLLEGEQSGGQNNSTNDLVTASASDHTQNMGETVVHVYPQRPEESSSNSCNSPAPSKISSAIHTGFQKVVYGPGRSKEDGDLKRRFANLEAEYFTQKRLLDDYITVYKSNEVHFRDLKNSNRQLQQRIVVLEGLEAQFKAEQAYLQDPWVRFKSDLTELTTRNAVLEFQKGQLQKYLSMMEYSKVAKSGSYTENSATPTLANDTLRRLSFTVDSLSSRLVKFMPNGSDQRCKLASKYSSVFFLRDPHFPVLTLKAEVMDILFKDFENESFTEAGLSVYLDDPVQRKKEFYALFQNFQKQNRGKCYASSSGWADRQFLKYYQSTKSRVWQIVGTDDSEDLQTLDQEFWKAAQSVWALHLLCFSFEPPASLFRVRNGAEFEKKYMEMAPGLQVEFKEDLLSKVAFMMTPGLQVDKFSVIKAEIYPAVTSSEPMET